MTFTKCELCDAETGKKCIFATVKRVINGKEHFFCSERHAEAFEKKMKKDKHWTMLIRLIFENLILYQRKLFVLILRQAVYQRALVSSDCDTIDEEAYLGSEPIQRLIQWKKSWHWCIQRDQLRTLRLDSSSTYNNAYPHHYETIKSHGKARCRSQS